MGGLPLDRKLVCMGVQFGRKLFGAAGLLVAVGMLSTGLGKAQRPAGSLAGLLTDTHSAPLANATVTVRNVITGAFVVGKTSRGGRYRFQDLAEGEYTLSATGPKGTGEVGGIVISPGHESHVQAVIDLTAGHSAAADLAGTRGEIKSKDRAQERNGRELLARAREQGNLVPLRMAPEMSFPLASISVLPVTSSRRSPPYVVSGLSRDPNVPLSIASVVAELEPIGLVALQNSALGARLPWRPEIAAVRFADVQQGESLDATQLESLPMSTDFALPLSDSRRSDGGADERHEVPDRASPRIIVDSLEFRSAFGGLHRGNGSEFATGASALGLVRRSGIEGVPSGHRDHAALNIETRHGTEHLHGQFSLFNLQRRFEAQNSSMQWVKESVAGSGSRVPTFTGDSFSLSDLGLRWGAGIGGVLHRPHLFWFGALDGYERNDSAMAAVRHPEQFFAQPTNDQMQLLSAQLSLSGIDPISSGVSAYSKVLESLAELLGPTARSSRQMSGFGRLDWKGGERHQFTLEGNGQRSKSPGGGSTRAWQTYGSHSLGTMDTASDWLLGRWGISVTPNLLAITQGSFGRHVQSQEPEEPSEFEQSLNINAWGRLPQIVVDSRDGFTIGNPARFGRGRYPDENIYSLQQQMKWSHGNVLLNAGGGFIHETDATSRLRNQTGTYYYSSVEDFAADSLAFFAFGLNGQLNPMNQHNCDQRGKPWRDAAGALHGLGYLPCYSYYSQMIGPSNWWLSTNDWSGHATAQWRTTKRSVFTLAMRWELEQLPAPISRLDNPDLPLTEHLPALGSQWGPRAGLAWGAGESRWPVLRLGYGMYFTRTPNAVIETALTQTGSSKGDLSFFMRPTDNLSGGGAPPFPYVLAGAPGKVVKPGAVEFAPSFHNGQVHQAELSIEETLPGRVHLEASGVASLGRRLPVTVDANIDPVTNPKTITYAIVDGNGSGPIKAQQITVPFFASWPSASSGSGGRFNSHYQQVSEISSRANSTYESMVLRLSRNAHGLMFRGRYTFGHAADWNPNESTQISGPSVLDPVDFRQEYGVSDLDVRHSATAAVILQPKWKLKDFAGYVGNAWMMSGVGNFHSGSPYTMRTAGSLAKEFNVNGQAIIGLSTGMNGYGGDNRVYGVGRNTYRCPATWKADLRIAKSFNLGQMRQLELMAESFNLFNHQNVTQIETVGYSIEQGTLNGAMPRLSFLTGLKAGQTEFGKALDINATDYYHPRQFQFGARMRF